MKISILAVVWLFAFVAVALLLAGNADFENELMEERMYCERVAYGTHLHYNQRIDCTKYQF